MIDTHVDVQLEDEFVTYSVTVNKQTQEPMKEYKVDEHGIVQEVKPTFEQPELDLGLPPELVPTEEKKEVLARKTIDAFIASGLAPSFDDLKLDYCQIMNMRLEDGLSYLKIASKLNISDGRLMQELDEYRKRVAPLAEKWGEWKENQKKVELDEKKRGNGDEGTGAA